jgi:hypothetical protein
VLLVSHCAAPYQDYEFPSLSTHSFHCSIRSPIRRPLFTRTTFWTECVPSSLAKGKLMIKRDCAARSPVRGPLQQVSSRIPQGFSCPYPTTYFSEAGCRISCVMFLVRDLTTCTSLSRSKTVTLVRTQQESNASMREIDNSRGFARHSQTRGARLDTENRPIRR